MTKNKLTYLFATIILAGSACLASASVAQTAQLNLSKADIIDMQKKDLMVPGYPTGHMLWQYQSACMSELYKYKTSALNTLKAKYEAEQNPKKKALLDKKVQRENTKIWNDCMDKYPYGESYKEQFKRLTDKK